MTTSSNRMRLRTGFLAVLVVLLACLAGCAYSNKAATLSGKVTYPTPDKPVTGGNITLHPSGSQPLSYQPPPGMKPPLDAPPIPIDTSNMPTYVKVPRKYAKPNTSALTCTVQTTGTQTQDFNLTD